MDTQIEVAALEDLAWIEAVHDRFYVQSGLYLPEFNEYVRRSIDAVRERYDTQRDRIWLARQDQKIVGSVAICHRDDDIAQLRYFFVDESARGKGLGQTLLYKALDFAAGQGYSGVMLWTMRGLESAEKLYANAGFERTRVTPAPWHETLHQERWMLEF